MKNKTRSFNYSIPTYAYLIGQIHWLFERRNKIKNESTIVGINLSITLLLCTYIESSLNVVLSCVIKEQKESSEDASHLRLLNNIEKRLSKASWTQYIDIGSIILPKALTHYSDNEIWKGISILFKLRNQLVHVKNVTASIQVDENDLKLKYTGIYEIAFEYFKEKGILRPNQLNSVTHKILSIRTTNHFVKIGEIFVDTLFYKLLKELKIDSLGDFISFKDGLIHDFGIDYKPVELPFLKNNKSDGLPFKKTKI